MNPEGIDFIDQNTGRHMKLVTEGTWCGWIVWKHPDGQWVSVRKATDDDVSKLRSKGAVI